MSTAATLFEVGDVVVWAQHSLVGALHLGKEFGDGPFTVVEVEKVPTHCQYPDSFCSDGSHSRHCNVNISKSVGHPQWVAIRLPNGEIPQNSGIYGGYRHLSGWWFTHEGQPVSGLEPEMTTIAPTYPGEEFPAGTGEYTMPGYPAKRA